jgi:hypothetical protein
LGSRPHGAFPNQKPRLENFRKALVIENVVIFCGHLEYFTTSGMFYGILVYFVVICKKFGKNYTSKYLK